MLHLRITRHLECTGQNHLPELPNALGADQIREANHLMGLTFDDMSSMMFWLDWIVFYGRRDSQTLSVMRRCLRSRNATFEIKPDGRVNKFSPERFGIGHRYVNSNLHPKTVYLCAQGILRST